MDHGATQPLLFSTPAESEHLLKEVHVALDFSFFFFFLDKCSIHQTATKKFSSIKCTTCFWKNSIKQTCYQVMRFLKKIKINSFFVSLYWFIQNRIYWMWLCTIIDKWNFVSIWNEKWTLHDTQSHHSIQKTTLLWY